MRRLVLRSCSYFSCFARSFPRVFYQVRTRVLIHIDNKIIGGSALENSDGVNLPVGWGDSILSGVVCRLVVLVCLSSGGGFFCLFLSFIRFLCFVCAYFVLWGFCVCCDFVLIAEVKVLSLRRGVLIRVVV